MLRVGTSGWQYASWRGPFYAEGVPKRSWLSHYADRFPTVEVNNTFYRLPERSTFEGWRTSVPDGFVFTCKLSRYLTHVRRLRDPADSVKLFLDRVRPLGDRLGPLLLQLPPDLERDRERLAETLDALDALGLKAIDGGIRVAVEPRHESWFVDQVADELARHNAALCWSDRHSRLLTPLWRTASWVYVRLHEGTASPRPCYGDRALTGWVERLVDSCSGDPDGYVYFNNDASACAPRNAARLVDLARRAGVSVTSWP